MAFDVDEEESVYVLNEGSIIKYLKGGDFAWRYRLRDSKACVDIGSSCGKVFCYLGFLREPYVTVLNSDFGEKVAEISVTPCAFGTSAGGAFFYADKLFLRRLDLIRFLKADAYAYVSLSDLCVSKGKKKLYSNHRGAARVQHVKASALMDTAFPNLELPAEDHLQSLMAHKDGMGYAGQTPSYIVYSCTCEASRPNCDEENNFDWWVLNKRTGLARFLEKESNLHALFLGSEMFRAGNDTTLYFYRELRKHYELQSAQFIKMAFPRW